MLPKPLDEAGWKVAFGDLTPSTQAKLRHWFATQALIIEDLGIAEDDWFGLVGWALDHPYDKEHLRRLDEVGPVASDGTEALGQGKQRSAALGAVGVVSNPQVATGPGLATRSQEGAGGGLQKELYQRFMNQRMNETTRRPKGPPPAKPIKR